MPPVRQVLRKGSHRRFHLLQLVDFIARRVAVAHRLQIDVVAIMRTSNHEELIDPSVKSIPLELAYPSRDLDGTGHERAGPLRPHHLKVVADHSKGGAQDTELVTLCLKISPHLGEIHS